MEDMTLRWENTTVIQAVGQGQRKAILGFDPGNETGYALTTNESILIIGQAKFKKPPKEQPGKRWAEYLNWIKCVIKRVHFMGFLNQIDLVGIAIERQIHGKNITTTSILKAFQIILELVTHQKNIPLFITSPAKIKSFATGKGNATKKQMEIMFKQRYPFYKELKLTEHQIDAIWISQWGYSEYRFSQMLNGSLGRTFLHPLL